MLFRKPGPLKLDLDPAETAAAAGAVIRRLERIDAHYRELESLLDEVERRLPAGCLPERPAGSDQTFAVEKPAETRRKPR